MTIRQPNVFTYGFNVSIAIREGYATKNQCVVFFKYSNKYSESGNTTRRHWNQVDKKIVTKIKNFINMYFL